MAATTPARGMGTFFKECEHPATRWTKCPHLYEVRYRDPGGKQVDEYTDEWKAGQNRPTTSP
ncbi:hypothetical protein [Streptomyces sp. NPDC054975]